MNDNNPLNNLTKLTKDSIKEGMLVWDNKTKEWFVISRTKMVLISLNKQKFLIYKSGGIPVEFEEKRFYCKSL